MLFFFTFFYPAAAEREGFCSAPLLCFSATRFLPGKLPFHYYSIVLSCFFASPSFFLSFFFSIPISLEKNGFSFPLFAFYYKSIHFEVSHFLGGLCERDTYEEKSEEQKNKIGEIKEKS